MHYIAVLEENRLADPASCRTIQNDDDTFNCPSTNCDGRVPITYWKDSRGLHPNISLQCPKCKKCYSILFGS